MDYHALAQQIKTWGRELGFQQVGIADTQIQAHGEHLQRWLAEGYHGSMEWMTTHADKRGQPELLWPNTMRVISARMDYLPEKSDHAKLLTQPSKAYVARYALGRDYHKLIRRRLAQLADKIAAAVADEAPNQRPFVDSAPVLERALAEKAGLGWIGKNTMLINAKAGSWFFLGEIFTTLALPAEPEAASNHCGSCRACLDICPTDAFVAPYQLDARKCISYLTIEHRGSIPEELRAPMGNRIFGCDDCQLICPWNKFAHRSEEDDFQPRHHLDRAELLHLFEWSETEFLENTAGSAIRRTGYEGWMRNISIALGNAEKSADVVNALQQKKQKISALVDEHIDWAIARQKS